MKIAIATDAWYPQTNGVVTTLNKTGDILQQQGHEVHFLTPQAFRTIPMPTYPEIRLSLFPARRLRKQLMALKPDAVHIATEGPIGFAVRSYCLKKGLPFTSSYHTRYPEYVNLRFPVPKSFTYRLLRWFHAPAERTLVPTESQRQLLPNNRFAHVEVWSRGVDTQLFRPLELSNKKNKSHRYIFVGRVAPEKNLEAFLRLDLDGKKCIVGDGPDLPRLRKQYPEVEFTGYQYGEKLVQTLATADVFVFPSKTDTFGLVMLEAMACGLPVAAFPVSGPLDVIVQGETGCLHEDLGQAIKDALQLNREAPRRYALAHSWEKAVDTFFSYLAPIKAD